MRRHSTWVLAAGLVLFSSALATYGPYVATPQPPEREADAQSTVRGFLAAYHSGKSDEVLLENLGYVKEWTTVLRETDDQRLAGPLAELISDTAKHSDRLTSLAIYVLMQVRARSAVSAVRPYLSLRSRPRSRLEAAAAMLMLGDAAAGIPILEEYARQTATLPWRQVSWSVTMPFLDSDWRAVVLPDSSQERLVVGYFRRIAPWVSGQNLTNTICYLLQKDERSREVACQAAAAALCKRGSDAAVRQSILVLLRKFGGERGRATLSRYE
jgi:hypothetical protein